MIQILTALILILISVCLQGCHERSESIPIRKSANQYSSLLVIDKQYTISTVKNLRTIRKKGDSHSPQDDIVFCESGGGVAYISQQYGKQYVVHNGTPGNPYEEISHLRISPDGKRVSYSAKLGQYLMMVSDNVASKPFVDVYDAVYSPDSRHVAYLAEGVDGLMNIMLDGKSIVAVSNVVTANFLFSNDSRYLIYHSRPNGGEIAYVAIYDISSGKTETKPCLDTAVIMSGNRARIAVVEKDELKQRVVDFDVASPNRVRRSVAYDGVKHLALSSDGASIAFVAGKGNHIYLVVNGREEQLPDSLGVSEPPVIGPDNRAALVMATIGGEYDRDYLLYQSGVAWNSIKKYNFVKEPVFNANGGSAYVAMEAGKSFVVVNGRPGPVFDAVVGPSFSADGRLLVYRVRTGESRLIVIADSEGKSHRRLPEYEMVFPPVFTADGTSIAFGVKEGNKLSWKVEKLK